MQLSTAQLPNKIQEILTEQEELFKSGLTLPLPFRINALKALAKSIKSNKEALLQGLEKDMGSDRLTGFIKDVGVTLQEIAYIRKNLKKWIRPKKRRAGLLAFPAFRGKVYNMPRGRTVIISPWNYPVLLTLVPLAYSIAAGNTAVVKPSEISVHTSKVVSKIIDETFSTGHVACIEGDKEVASELLSHKHGMIYFIGSERVGRIVAEAAAKTLTPVVLELGGKSPTVVDDEKHLLTSVRRIILGKWLNAGQTCVAPDYILVRDQLKEKFLDAVKRVVKEMGLDAQNSSNMSKIISENHLQRLEDLLEGIRENIVCGGHVDKNDRFMQFTVVENPPLDHRIMKEEIFGPILPILTYQNEDDLLEIIAKNPEPLAFYVFSGDRKFVERMHSKVQFGNGCINDTLFQFGVPGLTIGGVGTSGYGYNKGKEAFDEFSRKVSLLKKPRWIDTPFFYPPHGRISKLLAQLIFRNKI